MGTSKKFVEVNLYSTFMAKLPFMKKTFSTKTSLFIFGLSLLSLCVSAQKKKDKNAVWFEKPAVAPTFQWDGNYKGTTPCPDCDGIQTVLQIFPDNTYKLITKWIGKGDDVFEEKGKFLWKKEGNYIVMLKDGFTSADSSFALLSKDRLTLLDQNCKRIGGVAGPYYILTRDAGGLSDKYWKLTELNGKTINPGTGAKTPFLYINPKDNSFAGNGACNTLMGRYELGAGNKIGFGSIANTMMACPDMDIETAFKLALESTDHYFIRGDYLILENALNQQQAKLQIQYLK
ncbi:MAG: hypothetical protein CFE21_15735 [Bacteroidetes bacterium B1(2017)]|nr:MAG: hypothetical protein CFE21_15735 [Bacteroidetes bacterium B1(2017)]